MADEYEYEEISDEEKVKIAHHFLMSSPPGQIKEVLKDVRSILPSHLLQEGSLKGIFRAYNTKVHLLVDAPGAGHKMIICKEAEVDSAHYLDNRSRQIVGFDHENQTIIESDVVQLSPGKLYSPIEEHRSKTEKELRMYLEKQYTDQSAVSVFALDSKLVIVISAERLNLRNYWSGSWISRWEIEVAQGASNLVGVINLHVHYFEDGNLQLTSNKEEDHEISYTNAQTMAEGIVDAIKKAEDSIQNSMELMYINMSQETFKEMRRILPVTRAKMEWSVETHRMARSLGKSS